MARKPGKQKTYPRVAELLRKAVKEKGQMKVADESGLSQSAISYYAREIGEPTEATLEKLAAYFEVSVAWLRGEGVTEKRKWETLEEISSDFLIQYIDKIIKAYNAELLKGTSKGFPPEKYAASLWALTNFNQTDIADHLKCNYRTLVTWQSQTDFKELVAQHADQFTMILFDTIQSSFSQEIIGDAKKFIIIADSIINSNALYDFLGDSSIFTSQLIQAIIESLEIKINKLGEQFFSGKSSIGSCQYAIIAFIIINWLHPSVNDIESINKMKKINGVYSRIISDFISGFLENIYSELPIEDAKTLKAVIQLIISMDKSQ